jgi:hypothetical protein
MSAKSPRDLLVDARRFAQRITSLVDVRRTEVQPVSVQTR